MHICYIGSSLQMEQVNGKASPQKRKAAEVEDSDEDDDDDDDDDDDEEGEPHLPS